LFLELLHLGPAIEEIAKAIHSRFRQKHRKIKTKGDPAMRPWRDLSEGLRESNRLQAMHIPAKLKQIGYTFAPKSTKNPPVTFSDDEVEQLAILEHDRFVQERRLAGWKWGTERDPANKISPFLVSWEALKGMENDPQEWDRDAVRDIPIVLDKAGFELRKL
jgi:hypothetical protein